MPIKLYNQYFTVDTAKQWQKRGKQVFFFSDIRTVSKDKNTTKEIEVGVKDDMLLQQRCVFIMDPYRAHLKMRLPFIIPGIQEEKVMDYLEGDVMIQSFNGPTSTETRLVPIRDDNDKYSKTLYDNKKYESQLFYHNTVVREKQRFFDPITNEGKVGGPLSELDDRFDSIHLVYVVNLYLQSKGGEVTLSRALQFTSELLKKLSDLHTSPRSLAKMRQQAAAGKVIGDKE